MINYLVLKFPLMQHEIVSLWKEQSSLVVRELATPIGYELVPLYLEIGNEIFFHYEISSSVLYNIT